MSKQREQHKKGVEQKCLHTTDFDDFSLLEIHFEFTDKVKALRGSKHNDSPGGIL